MTHAPVLQPPLLSVRHLAKTFSIGTGWRPRRVPVLHDVSFDLHAGEVVALVGESGSGKSTTARVIARLSVPTAGEIWLNGENVLRSEPRGASLAYRRCVQMIFQDPFAALNPLHTIRYHLERPLRRLGNAKGKTDLKQQVDRLLETVGLTPVDEFADKHPHQASGGQRQRVAVARALATNPALILADEPTSMLDVSIRIDLLNLLADLKISRRIAYLFITHDLGSARYFADRILVMYAGHIVEAGPCETLLDAPAHPYTQLLVAAVPTANAAMTPSVTSGGGAPKTAVPASGCPFADRCPGVMNRCREELPAAREVTPGHTVSCHLYEG
jgi:peptide/nickel transport system ATP-binding protein